MDPVHHPGIEPATFRIAAVMIGLGLRSHGELYCCVCHGFLDPEFSPLILRPKNEQVFGGIRMIEI